ncbi:unnamed protein product [Cyclocybe aegerita]|uniref:Uncharacterized protein n=1 Tax=Cyclocybe aegerita TaxID=1973307 RepID=A0A8S0W1Z4_CYCAE|nr:unnamed protein product [Cyclocybe aegerita]
MSTKAKESVKSLPLANVLQDLAILRASGMEIPQALTSPMRPVPATPELNSSSVSTSYEFIRYSRGAIKLQHSGKVEVEGQRIEEIRIKYETLCNVLRAHTPSQE